MTTKSDWQAVGHNMTAGQGRQPGDPPTTEEMLAHSRGELSEADAQRVQQWLDANPDMARALTQPFPEDDAKPGDPDYLSEEELSRRWLALQKEIRPAGNVRRFPWITALAAAVALVFAGLYVFEVQRTRTPELFTIGQELEPVGHRRGRASGARTLDVTQRRNDIALKLTKPAQYSWYRIEIWPAAGDPQDPLWASEPTQPRAGQLEMILPDRFLRPGVYSIKVLGLDERPNAELVDQYLVRVPAR
jgi:hypothetical protein